MKFFVDSFPRRVTTDVNFCSGPLPPFPISYFLPPAIFCHIFLSYIVLFSHFQRPHWWCFLWKSTCKSVPIALLLSCVITAATNGCCAQNNFQVLKPFVVSFGLLMVDLRRCVVSGSWRKSRWKVAESMRHGSDYMTSGCLQASSRILEPQHGDNVWSVFLPPVAIVDTALACRLFCGRALWDGCLWCSCKLDILA